MKVVTFYTRDYRPPGIRLGDDETLKEESYRLAIGGRQVQVLCRKSELELVAKIKVGDIARRDDE